LNKIKPPIKSIDVITRLARIILIFIEPEPNRNRLNNSMGAQTGFIMAIHLKRAGISESG
jgi:hypothetical protein